MARNEQRRKKKTHFLEIPAETELSETRLPLTTAPLGVQFNTVLKGLQQDGKTPAEIKQALRSVKSTTDEEILAIDFSTDWSVLIEQFKAQINEALTAGAPLDEVDPHRLFYHLQNDPWVRKLRLFCVSCVRRLEKILTNAETTRLALAAAERYADAECSLKELARIEVHAEEETREADTYKVRNAWRAVTWMLSAEMDALGKARSVVEGSALATKNARLEKAFQAKLLRDVFGNPFRSTGFSREWQSVEVVSLAREMYSARNFRSMRALATYLENAGCSNEEILAQCRSRSPHVRGCWVVDLILGKE